MQTFHRGGGAFVADMKRAFAAARPTRGAQSSSPSLCDRGLPRPSHLLRSAGRLLCVVPAVDAQEDEGRARTILARKRRL